MGSLSRAVLALNRVVERRPVVCAVGAGFGLASLGDGMAQQGEPGNHTHDWHRTSLTGLWAAGSAACFWLPFYAWLDRRFGMGKGMRAIASKTCMDSFVALPLYELPSYSLCTVAPRLGWEASWAKLRESYGQQLVAGLGVWLPSSAIMFMWVPPHFRILYIYSLDVGWTCLLSYLGNNEPG